jgi:hypothetical protein
MCAGPRHSSRPAIAVLKAARESRLGALRGLVPDARYPCRVGVVRRCECADVERGRVLALGVAGGSISLG